MPESLTITIKNDLSTIEPVSEVIADFVAQCQLPPKIAFDLNLSLDELLTNAILYGYEDGQQGHEISIHIALVGDFIELEIEDDGRPFNPLETPEPDLQADLMDRPIGGLGFHLVRKLTDQIEYQRRAGKNLLTIKKLARRQGETASAPD
jgi:anti-sigma regulatory factor (Ser/Thr protein kinase)